MTGTPNRAPSIARELWANLPVILLFAWSTGALIAWVTS